MPVIGPTPGKEPERVPLELTAAEQQELEERTTALRKLLKDDVRAKYKVELMFVGRRSMHQPTVGAVCLWESGAKLHGGGDVAMYLCPGKSLEKNECEMPIPSECNKSGRIVCPHCQSVWASSEAHNVLLARLPMRKWAEVLYKYYRLLGHNADIYLKHSSDDIRDVLQKDMRKKANGEIATLSEVSTALHIYPLVNIIKDTAAGADVLSRFHTFLTA